MATTAPDAATRAAVRGLCADLEPLLTVAMNEAVRATLRARDSADPRDLVVVALERAQASLATSAAKLRASEGRRTRLRLAALTFGARRG